MDIQSCSSCCCMDTFALAAGLEMKRCPGSSIGRLPEAKSSERAQAWLKESTKFCNTKMHFGEAMFFTISIGYCHFSVLELHEHFWVFKRPRNQGGVQGASSGGSQKLHPLKQFKRDWEKCNNSLLRLFRCLNYLFILFLSTNIEKATELLEATNTARCGYM